MGGGKCDGWIRHATDSQTLDVLVYRIPPCAQQTRLDYRHNGLDTTDLYVLAASETVAKSHATQNCVNLRLANACCTISLYPLALLFPCPPCAISREANVELM